MQTKTSVVPISKTRLWLGRIVTAIFVLFLLADGFAHLTKPASVIKAFHQLGLPIRLSVSLGVLQLLGIFLYLLPRTSILGMILLTGYLGGATAIHVRAGSPMFPVLFPVIVGAALWLGLILRKERLQAVLSEP